MRVPAVGPVDEVLFEDQVSRRARVGAATARGVSGRVVLLMAAILFPAVVSLWILYAQGFSAPYQDDYHSILSFALEYLHSANRLSTFAASQHNEYKLAFEHAVELLDLRLTHHLNFAWLTSVGTLFVPLTGCLLWRMNLTSAKSLEGRLVAFVPVSLLFFSLTYWENMDWTMTTLQNLPVIFFSLLSLHLLVVRPAENPGGGRVLLACVCAMLAALTSANGFFLAPVGFCFLVFHRRYARAAAWGLAFVLPLGMYLYRYQRYVEPHGPHAMAKRAAFFVGFFGGLIPSPWLALAAGLVVMGVLVLVWRKGFAGVRPDVACFVVWMVMTDAAGAWVRGAMGAGIPSRYSMYSLLFVIACYAGVSGMAVSWPVERRQRAYGWVLAATFVFWAGSEVRAYHGLKARHDMVMRGIGLYRGDPARQSPMIDPKVDKIAPLERVYEQQVLTEAIREGIYVLPGEAGR